MAYLGWHPLTYPSMYYVTEMMMWVVQWFAKNVYDVLFVLTEHVCEYLQISTRKNKPRWQTSFHLHLNNCAGTMNTERATEAMVCNNRYGGVTRWNQHAITTAGLNWSADSNCNVGVQGWIGLVIELDRHNNSPVWAGLSADVGQLDAANLSDWWWDDSWGCWYGIGWSGGRYFHHSLQYYSWESTENHGKIQSGSSTQQCTSRKIKRWYRSKISRTYYSCNKGVFLCWGC